MLRTKIKPIRAEVLLGQTLVIDIEKVKEAHYYRLSTEVDEVEISFTFDPSYIQSCGKCVMV